MAKWRIFDSIFRFESSTMSQFQVIWSFWTFLFCEMNSSLTSKFHSNSSPYNLIKFFEENSAKNFTLSKENQRILLSLKLLSVCMSSFPFERESNKHQSEIQFKFWVLKVKTYSISYGSSIRNMKAFEESHWSKILFS